MSRYFLLGHHLSSISMSKRRLNNYVPAAILLCGLLLTGFLCRGLNTKQIVEGCKRYNEMGKFRQITKINMAT